MDLKKFWDGIQKDFRLFLFAVVLLELYRAIFIWLMADYISANSTSEQIYAVLLAGLRLSLKTAGVVTAISFVAVTIFGLKPRVRIFIGIIFSLIFSTLFLIRFPYFREFNATFGIEIVRGWHESFFTILGTLFEDYGLIWRIPTALFLTIFGAAVLSRFLRLKTIPLPEFGNFFSQAVFVVATLIFIGVFAVFVRFGGSLTYDGGIHWENSAITSDKFLNECILDDGQALYRTYAMAREIGAGTIPLVEETRILESAQYISGKTDLVEDTLAPYLEKVASGARIETPRHIFIIVGENFMQWTLLGKYENLHVADGIKSIIAEKSSYYSRNFLPTGETAAAAVSGLVTGFPEMNLRLNYLPKTYEGAYISAAAPPLKKLGYRVDFWYGGELNWENIQRMAIAQDFSDFYGLPDLNAPKFTEFGVKDEDLFKAIEEHLADEPPTVHFILTTTNQPPYNLDLAAEGFDVEKTLAEIKKLPNVPDAETLAVELGNFWYTDKVITRFIRNVAEKYPDSLFVVTGDHALRVDPSSQPTIFEHQSVPFILYGAGIDENILPPDVVGGHISIVPTIIELIAPEGFRYYSIAPTLFENFGVAFNREVYLTETVAGKIGSDEIEILPHVASADLHGVNLSQERAIAENFISAMRTVSSWILKHGLNF